MSHTFASKRAAVEASSFLATIAETSRLCVEVARRWRKQRWMVVARAAKEVSRTLMCRMQRRRWKWWRSQRWIVEAEACCCMSILLARPTRIRVQVAWWRWRVRGSHSWQGTRMQIGGCSLCCVVPPLGRSKAGGKTSVNIPIGICNANIIRCPIGIPNVKQWRCHAYSSNIPIGIFNAENGRCMIGIPNANSWRCRANTL
jgi:hypothetical protein